MKYPPLRTPQTLLAGLLLALAAACASGVGAAHIRASLPNEIHRRLSKSECLRMGPTSVAGAQLLREIRRCDVASSIAVEAVCLQLLGELELPHKSDPQGAPAWLRRAEQMLHDGCDTTLTVRSVAAECGVHAVHLARMFRKFRNQTPGAYLRRCRIERAAQRLSTGVESLSTVALSSGFSDQSHFTHASRHRFSVTRGAFRSMLIGGRKLT